MEFTVENLEKILSLGFNEAIASHKKEVVAFYAFVFNDPEACSSCDSKLMGYWQALNRNGITILNKKIMSNSKFKIKEGVPFLQMEFGSGTFFSNETITDDLAIEYLKKNPNRISNFSQFPENWKKLTGSEADATTVNIFDKEYSAEDAAQLFKEAGIKTTAKTIDGLTKKFESLSETEKESLQNFVNGTESEEEESAE